MDNIARYNAKMIEKKLLENGTECCSVDIFNYFEDSDLFYDSIDIDSWADEYYNSM